MNKKMKSKSQKTNHITVFEHQSLKIGNIFTEKHCESLEAFYGNKGVPYFSLIHKGVRFNEYVGILQIGNLVIEILPKADKTENKSLWRKKLIGMLHAVNYFNIKAPSSSALNIKTNSILDLYFELFIKEVEYLLNKGLVKKYRKIEGNSLALKGSIIFSQHIQQNLIHKEKFYVRHTTYDKTHNYHKILYQTILLLKRINTNISLNSRIGNLLLNFPEMETIKITETVFNKIIYNRKTEGYKNAIEIAKLLLLNYHPDLKNGQNNVLALMFDMNLLWEKFIYVSLRKKLKKGMTITAQTSKSFWKLDKGYSSTLRPDIVIKDENNVVVLDTKWKNIGNSNPKSDDLRQMYVYHEYFNAEKVALVYPGDSETKKGNYYKIDGNNELSEKKCSIIKISTDEKEINDWQTKIADQIFENFFEKNNDEQNLFS